MPGSSGSSPRSMPCLGRPCIVRSGRMVELVEAYRDFAAPCDARSTVAELLEAVPPEHLAGLRWVVLTNSAALPGPPKRGRSLSRGKKARHFAAAGLYHAAWQGQAAWIEIFVDKTLYGPPRWLLKLPLVRNILLLWVLFHQFGHHIQKRSASRTQSRRMSRTTGVGASAANTSVAHTR